MRDVDVELLFITKNLFGGKVKINNYTYHVTG